MGKPRDDRHKDLFRPPSDQIMEGADIYQIAKICHNSVEMIEKYFVAKLGPDTVIRNFSL